MRATEHRTPAQARSATPLDRLLERSGIGREPGDPVYRERYAQEMIGGFRVLSLLVFASMSLLFLVHAVQPGGFTGGLREGPSPAACALLALAGGISYFAARWVRTPNAAFFATAALLVSAVAVMSVDNLRRAGIDERSATSLLPALLSTLVLTAALLPLEPLRMFGLGALLLATSSLAALVVNVRLQLEAVEVVAAATVIAVSVATAARSTSQRIRVHEAHAETLAAERKAEAARERALLAESAITMERLAASLSHELNTPIGVLKSASQTLCRQMQKEASARSGNTHLVNELSTAIASSTQRLSEAVARIQRFANLDRSAIRLVDVNQLVQDAVALMNPPSVNEARVRLRLEPLPAIWCKPHPLSVAVASILNRLLESAVPVTIETFSGDREITVRIAQSATAGNLSADMDLRFSVEDGRVRTSGWDLFAARQLLRQNGARLGIGYEVGQQVVLIAIPIDAHLPVRANRPAVEVS